MTPRGYRHNPNWLLGEQWQAFWLLSCTKNIIICLASCSSLIKRHNGAGHDVISNHYICMAEKHAILKNRASRDLEVYKIACNEATRYLWGIGSDGCCLKKATINGQ